MQKNTLKYSTLVFLGGASYGVMAATVKMTYAAGFSWTQAVASQALFGTLLFAIALAVSLGRGRKPAPLTPKRILSLMGLGLNTCATCVLYNLSLTMLPVSAALTMLFQFTWIGIVIQVAVTRRKPQAAELVAAVAILGGTLFASGMFSSAVGELHTIRL